MEERFDTGFWYWTVDDRFLYFGGMIGDAHKTEEAAMEAIRERAAVDISDGWFEKRKSDGVVIIYFIGHVIPREDNCSLIEMSSYVSELYGDEIIEALRDYDSYQKINLHVI